MQLLLIWLVPILGSALVAAMLLPCIQVKRRHLPLWELLVLSAFTSSLNRSVEGKHVHGDVTDGSENAHEVL